MSVGEFVFPDVMRGITDASITRRRSTPRTLSRSSTTAIASEAAPIFAVPTAIAGIYGMNFEHMPELGWSFGYPLVIAAIGVICGYVYWRFKRSGWL